MISAVSPTVPPAATGAMKGPPAAAMKPPATVESVQRSAYATHPSAMSREQQARQAAEELVATALIQPMLASMRESELGAEPFKPGLVEERFGPMFDQHVADRITGASNFSLVDTIVDRLLNRSSDEAAPADDAGSTDEAADPGDGAHPFHHEQERIDVRA